MENKSEILIKRPTLSAHDGWTRMSADIVFPDVGTRTLWIEFEDKFAPYLCFERSDAFLVAMLPIALRDHVNIRCEAPVGEVLLYQIKTYLLPILVKGERSFQDVEILTEVDSATYETFAVGTGVSCGIDSFHAIMSASSQTATPLRLTHLTMFNVGAFYKKDGGQFLFQQGQARKVASELGLELVIANSNFTVYEFDKKLWHLYTHVYNNAFAILALQKMWKTYYYSSAYDFTHFSVMNSAKGDPAHYELLFWDCVTTPSLRVYNEGGAMSRFDKTQDLIDFQPAQKYLNVCVDESGKNCGMCFKCRRTLLSLDALGALDRFGEVFDISAYRENRTQHLYWLVRQKHLKNGDKLIDEAYEVLSHELPRSLFYRAVIDAKFENNPRLYPHYRRMRGLASRMFCMVKRVFSFRTSKVV